MNDNVDKAADTADANDIADKVQFYFTKMMDCMNADGIDVTGMGLVLISATITKAKTPSLTIATNVDGRIPTAALLLAALKANTDPDTRFETVTGVQH